MKNKKKFKSISVNILIVFISVLVLTGLVFKPKEANAVVNRDTIRILEIQPTNVFKLTEISGGNATTGIEQFKSKYNGKNVIVEHMTMAEYISKVEQINGKYDVVVIGRYSGNYTAPFQSSPGYLPYGREVKNIGNNNNNLSVGIINNTVLKKNNKTYVEYYSENDITNKRANEILELINSGQLVYIANEAMINGSKIKSNFSTISKENFIKTADNNITITDIMNRYTATANKVKYRPILTVNNKPVNNNRNMNFTFNLSTESDNPVRVNLYLDVNGDGLFKDKELVKKIDVTPVDKRLVNGTISYTLPNDFIGRLTWKLEMVTNENVKAYELGDVNYRSIDGSKPNIRVLQIFPTGQNILDLTSDSKIRTLINGINDYTISISKLDTNNFNSTAGKSLRLNGNYDMVILGFADSYGNADFTENAITELKDFIRTGQSVMFTHDTLTYRILPYEVIDVSDKSSKNSTYAFRDIIGQSRYKDVEYNPSEVDIYKRYNALTGGYETRNIPHDSVANSNAITYGISDGILKMYSNSANAGSYDSSKPARNIYKINEGLINQYPYELEDIQVADTHYQWYQLNLEDEDVVPWYTLVNDSGGYNKYDARNYYYTYSKGSITYSGTGHSNSFTEAEKKLFVNTMVKASRGANHAPTLEVINLENNQAFSKKQDKIEFTVIPSDMDNDKLTTKITVKNSSGQVVGQPIVYENREQGVPIAVAIPKSSYDFSNMGGSMTLEIETVDPLEAKVGITRVVSLVNDPTIALQYTTDRTGYLKGDTARITLNAIANPGDINNGGISNIRFTANTLETAKYRLNLATVNYDDVTFDSSNSPNPGTQSKTIEALIRDEGNITISGKLTYTHNGQDIIIPYDITLVSQIGKINVSIVDENGQLINGGSISVTSPNNNIPGTINFAGEIQLFSNLTSGEYSFTLQQPFTVDGVKYISVNDQNTTINLEYDSSNTTKTVEFKVTSTLGDNVPNISVKLDGATPNPSYSGEDITITYKVTPEDFTSKILNTESGIIDEVIFITDLSQMMTQGQRFSVLQNSITNRVLNNSNLNRTKFGVIGYNESISIGDRNNKNDPKDVSMKSTTNVNELLVPLFDISDGNSKDGFRLLFQDGRMTLSSNNTRNIDGALTMAKNTFNKFGTQDKRKAIVLISAGEVNYTSAVVQDIKSQGYKIISLDISADSNTNLQSFHQALGGDTTDYLVGTIDGGNYNAVDSDMTKVAERLISGVINRPYPSVYSKLNFDLNSNFQYVDGSISSNVSNVVLGGEKLFLELAPIKYTYTDRTTDNSYRYSSSEMVVSFKVRANAGRSGELSFAVNPTTNDELKNFITYNRFNNNEVKNAMDTPIITIGTSNIQHGVYEGIKNNPPIYTGNARELARDSNVTMGALFNIIRNESDIKLTVAPSLNVNDDIKIYKVLDNGDLEFIANMTISASKVYSYRLNTAPGTRVLVLYNVTVPTDIGTYTNTIYVGPESRDAVIKVQDLSLPDLF